MTDLHLLQSQRNAVGTLILVAGLDPLEFTWTQTSTETIEVGPGRDPVMVSKLVHEPTGFFFVFDFDVYQNHVRRFRPGRDTPEERSVVGGWDAQLGQVERWLAYLYREYDEPDLWAELTQQRDLVRTPPGIEDSPFTADEQLSIERQLRVALDAIRQTHELTADQFQALEGKIDYLVEAAGQFGRLHWRQLFLGGLVEVAMQHALSPELVSHFVRLTLGGLV